MKVLAAANALEVVTHPSTSPMADRCALAVFHTLSTHLAVLDDCGTILAANQAPRPCTDSGGQVPAEIPVGASYLRVCNLAAEAGQESARALAEGVQEVLAGRSGTFSMEYACPVPGRNRWFVARVVRLQGPGAARVVVEHQDVTEQWAARAALLQSEARLRTVLDHVPEAIFLKDLQSRYLLVNRRFAESVRMTPESIVGKTAHEILPARSADVALENERRALTEGQAVRDEEEIVLPDGPHTMIVTRVPVVGASGVSSAVCAIATDITERKRAEEALHASEARFRLLVEYAADAVFLLDARGRLLDANRRACEGLGYTREELLGMDVSEIATDLARDEIARLLVGMAPGEPLALQGIHRRRDGSTFPVEVRLVLAEKGRRRLYIALARDVTEQRRAIAELEYQATHDELTGLPNRSRLIDCLGDAIRQARENDLGVALLLIDLDDFKEINDTFGHHFGDLVLQRLKPRLRSGLDGSDMVARLGGDEFAILLPGTDRDGALCVAQRLESDLHRLIEIGGHRVDIAASIGIALFPDHGADAHELMRQADVAMYAAKRERAGVLVFAPEQSRCTPHQLSLLCDLRQAVEAEKLHLHYQPKIDIETGRVWGAEALARWNHPAEGVIAPTLFIPLAEHTGLIRPIALWVLGVALRECAAWHAAGVRLNVSVNLAADNLQDPHLGDTIETLRARAGVPPGCLTVEVTESSMVADPVRARTALSRLHDVGVRVAIDDFGTGYSSLAYLKDLPTDEVKIDRTFVKEMITDARAACITRAVIDLGHDLGLCVVAEGVEDAATRDLLADWGCDSAQGYFFSRPLPPEEFLRWVKQPRSGEEQPARNGPERHGRRRSDHPA